jgi:hypothetical protein
MHVYNVLYHNCTYNRLPEDEPSVSIHVKEVKKIENYNINLGNTRARFIGLYCKNNFQCTMQKT